MRLCVFASTTWPDIYRLLTTTVAVSLKIRVNGARHVEFDKSLLDRTDVNSSIAESQSRAVDAELLEYVKSLRSYQPLTSHKHGAEEEVRAAAVKGLQRYSVGPGSARWFYGSFDVFVALEQRLAKLYPSIIHQSGKTRGRSAEAQLVCPKKLTISRYDLLRYRAWDRDKRSSKCCSACIAEDKALGLH